MTDNVVVERMGQPRMTPRINRFPMMVARQGLSMGMALAMICSWEANTSVGWAFIHGVMSWVYVLYYAVAY